MIQKNSLVHFKYNVEKNDYSQPYRVVKTWVWSPHVNARLEQIENVKYKEIIENLQYTGNHFEDLVEDNGEYQRYIREQKLERIVDENTGEK